VSEQPTVPRPSPRDVVLAALAVALPCPACGRTDGCRCLVERPQTEDRADLVVAALIEHGHLPSPTRPVTEDDVAEVARWLAEESRHPRYTQVEDGWHRLLESEPDVDLACARALTNAANDGDRESVLHARTMLLRWQREHPTQPQGGTE
jgi:hypothetical protein